MNKDIYNQKIYFLNGEIKKIGDILSNRTNETGILLTIAGLLSFLPQIVLDNSSYLFNFLTWTFWFLLVALIIYYPVSLRVSAIVKGRPFASTGSEQEIEILKNQADALEIIWRKSVINHDSVAFWYRLLKGFVYAYIFSFVSNLYFFVYFGEPRVCVSINLLIASLLIIIVLFLFPMTRSQKNRVIGAQKEIKKKQVFISWQSVFEKISRVFKNIWIKNF